MHHHHQQQQHHHHHHQQQQHTLLTDHTMPPHGPTPQQNRQLVELLVAAELQQYLHSLNSQLNVNTVRQLKAVTDDDFVTVLGMSKPEVRRLRKFIKKMAGQSGTLEKIKNILSKSTHETSELCCLPVTDKSPTSFLIDQSDITISKELGRGTFGSVHSGTWITSSGSKLPIAARKCPLMDSSQRDYFLSSAQSLHLLKHPNVVRLIGVSMTTSQFLMVMEQAPTGQSLKSWLQASSAPPVSVSVLLGQLVEFNKQICSALTYLESCKFVHGDLSARNVLVFSDELVKVTDQGLRAALDREDELLKSLVERNSQKMSWFAPECLEFSTFSTFSVSSDVWSFGVTMWEVFSLGDAPTWNARDSAELLSIMRSGKVLDRPRLCPKDFHSVMFDCWRFNPQDRPTFQQLGTRLGKLNLVRLQMESDPVMMATSGKEHQLQLNTGDLVTVLDSSSGEFPVSGWWKGLNEATNQIGFFNPVNMRLFSGGDGTKQSVAKQQTASSSLLRKAKLGGQQKQRLTAGMISLPLNDLRHTSHVGRNGETFSCQMIPISQMSTPTADQMEEMTGSTSSAISSTVSISPTSESEGKRRDPLLRSLSQKPPPSSMGSDRMLNGTHKESPPTGLRSSAEPSLNPSRDLTSKLSVGSNLSGDILMRVKYSPSSLSMVSADLSHVTSLMSSDTLTDVSSLPGDIGSLSKSDYEDYDCMDGEQDETFDISTTDVEERDHSLDSTVVCQANGEDNYHDEVDDDSPRTIEEPHTPKILDTSSLFDEVMFALNQGIQPQTSKPIQNGHHSKSQSQKRATFDIYNSEGTDCDLYDRSTDSTPRGLANSIHKCIPQSKVEVNESKSTEVVSTSTVDDILQRMTNNASLVRVPNGRQDMPHANVCYSYITTCSTISLMSSSSDLKSSDSSLSSDAAALANSSSRVSVLSKISNALGRPKAKENQRRFSQASTMSRLSVAMTNTSSSPPDQELINSKLSSSSFSGFDGRKPRVIPLESLPLQDKYPSFLPSKSRSLKNSKAKDKLRRSSLILASVFQPKRDDKHKRPIALPTSNFNMNELFFNKLREQEQEIAERAEQDSRRLKEEEGEAESEDSGVALQSLNQSQEVMPPCQADRDYKDFSSSPNDSPRQDRNRGLVGECGSDFSNMVHEEQVSDLSEIFLRLNMARNQVTANSVKLGGQNGKSRDLTSIQEINQLSDASQRIGVSDIRNLCMESRALHIPIHPDAGKRELTLNNNKSELHTDFQAPSKILEGKESHYDIMRDPFFPGFNSSKLSLAKTHSSRSNSPEV